jgi:hypothetical protein
MILLQGIQGINDLKSGKKQGDEYFPKGDSGSSRCGILSERQRKDRGTGHCLIVK